MHLPNHGQMNYGYNAYNHPQYVNQLAHNPYIGYAPHNSLHAAYNMNFFNWRTIIYTKSISDVYIFFIYL